MSFSKHFLLAATLLLGSISTTAAAPVPSLDLISRGTDEVGHFLETRGEDVYLRFREAGEESSIGEIAKPKFPMKSKTTITKAKPPRKPTRARKPKESSIWTKKVSGKPGAKNLANDAARKLAAHKAKGSRKSTSEKHATGTNPKKTKSRSGHRRHRGPERKGNAGGRNQGSSQNRMRKRNGNSRPPTPGPAPRPASPPPPYSELNIHKPLPPTPVGTFQKVVDKAKSLFKPKKP